MNHISLIITVILITYFSGVYSQKPSFDQKPSLEETEDWIKEKIEIHDIFNYRNGAGYGRGYSIKFMDGNMVIWELIYLGSDTSSFAFIKKCEIPINEMRKLEVEVNETTCSMIIRIRGYNEKILCQEIEEDGQDVFTQTYRLELVLNETFAEENLPERMVNAFNHLIELHGGHVVKEVF